MADQSPDVRPVQLRHDRGGPRTAEGAADVSGALLFLRARGSLTLHIKVTARGLGRVLTQDRGASDYQRDHPEGHCDSGL